MIDLTGRIFHRLTVLQPMRYGRRGTSWLCECACGKSVVIGQVALISGTRKSCGCLYKEQSIKNCRHRQIPGPNSPQWTGYGDIPGGYWWRLSDRAGKRNFEFSITIEEAWDLFVAQDKRCALSGRPLCFAPTQARNAEQTASLDRIDSELGYTKENCQWLHKEVNSFKSDIQQDRLISLCDEISTYRGLTFSSYQSATAKTAVYPEQGEFGGLLYLALGLCGEAGEVAEKIKKIWRDSNGHISDEVKTNIIKELGDVSWYWSEIATHLGVSLEDVTRTNIEKLRSRKERGVIQGSGDNR